MSLLFDFLRKAKVGISDTLSKSALDNTSAGSFLVTLAITQIPIALLFLYLEHRQNPRKSDESDNTVSSMLKNVRSAKNHRSVLLSALLLVLGQLFFWLSFENVFASIASPISGTSIMFTVVLSALVLKEKISSKNLIGIAIIIIGIITIAL